MFHPETAKLIFMTFLSFSTFLLNAHFVRGMIKYGLLEAAITKDTL